MDDEIGIVLSPLVAPEPGAASVRCRVDVSSATAGERQTDVDLPLLDGGALDELEALVTALPADQASIGTIARGQQEIAATGQALFDATLGPWGQWAALRERCRSSRGHLRVVVRSPDLGVATQPWELMADRDSGGFLALQPGVTLVRDPHRVAPGLRPPINRPLRVLLCAALPSDVGPIDVEGEVGILVGVLLGLGAAVEVERVTPHVGICTREQLREALERRGPWHVLHFSGHGDFDPLLGGSLVFTDAAGRSAPSPTAEVARLLGAHPSLRLVVLNACRGAMGGGRLVNGSLAGALIDQGIPAAVAMQFRITDLAALPFARAFYLDLLRSGDVDAAVAAARDAVAGTVLRLRETSTLLRSAEWASPVLHLESDPQLFPPGDPAVAPADAPPPPLRLPGAVEKVARLRWRLTYTSDLPPDRTWDRLEAALRATSDVRRLERTGDALLALVGGVFPGSVAATEEVEAHLSDDGTMTVESFPHQWVLLDQGRNRDLVLRLARHLGVG